MATVYGPDKFTVPTGPDAPDVPATIITLLDSMRPSLIGHASSIADRTAKYGRASASSIQAPKGTVVVSAELNAIWVKTSDTLDEWATIIQHSDEVATVSVVSTQSDQVTTVQKFTIPESGIYALYASMNDQNGLDVDGSIREIHVLVNGTWKFGGIFPASKFWLWSGSRTTFLNKGDTYQIDFMQRSGGERSLKVTLSYQRIL
ncbi:Hypothetical protein PFR_JS22-PH_19 [Propionibacterium freudenreichii]|uniref:hypothetical protein n=1 Tax=Propionibacterium freudenreichii TaxID=1744 RepID=UPI00054453F6|nr:hypothetical protein [Propionibacterium freudenreichii]CEH07851.1 Putative uncharacterized protein [Propionibacterium freudenreichii]SBW77593.1 Hypothetical protein PFR_JS22-1_1945 [Propionibacterium freudenreichii]SCP02347.1 Hypothetical protein PFR_JS22-PH_19 [Propionibacterium freudenreichii]